MFILKKYLIINLIISGLITLTLILFSDEIMNVCYRIVEYFGYAMSFAIFKIDFFLIGFIPVWSMPFYINDELFSWKDIVKGNLRIIISVTILISVQVLLIMNFRFISSPFIPENIVMQPIPFYWTIGILFGILLPLGIHRIQNKSNSSN